MLTASTLEVNDDSEKHIQDVLTHLLARIFEVVQCKLGVEQNTHGI